MNEAVIIALIPAIASVIAVLLANNKQSTDMDARLDKHQAVTDTKLQSLTAEVEKHNSVIERVYKLEQDAAVSQNRIKVSEHRLDDIERKLQ